MGLNFPVCINLLGNRQAFILDVVKSLAFQLSTNMALALSYRFGFIAF